MVMRKETNHTSTENCLDTHEKEDYPESGMKVHSDPAMASYGKEPDPVSDVWLLTN